MGWEGERQVGSRVQTNTSYYSFRFLFFFVKEAENLQSSIPKVLGRAKGNEKAIYQKNFEQFGWIKTLYELAECGVFNSNDKTPINSVLHTNTGEVFHDTGIARDIY